MASYTKIDIQEANRIIAHYDFPKAIELRPLSLGISNSNYQVILENNETILLKISNDKTIEQLTNEQKILNILSHHAYPYSLTPFKTLEGKSIYKQEKFYGVIFPFVLGHAPKIEEAPCIALAKALAHLHLIKLTDEELKSVRSYENVGYGGLSIVEYTKDPKCPPFFKDSFYQCLPNGLDGIDINKFEKGIIHGDLYYDNSLFNEEELVSLIDFEQSGFGSFILDLGIAISGTCLKNGEVDRDLMRIYLNAYQEVRPLPVNEMAHIDTAVVVGLFSISLWRIKRFYEGNLDHSKKLSYQELCLRAEIFCKNKVSH